MNIKSIIIFSFFSIAAHGQTVDEYYWFDGKDKRAIKLVEDVLVEVPNANPSAAPAEKVPSGSKQKLAEKMTEKLKSIPSAFKIEKVESQGRLTKVYVRSNNFREDIKQNLGGNFSPLFQDGPGAKALAGGVIVTFKTEKTDAEAQAWAETQNVKLKNKMGLINGRTWLVESAAGLASLDLANQLYQAPDVEFSQPNWAHDHVSRTISSRRILRHQQNKDVLDAQKNQKPIQQPLRLNKKILKANE